MLFAYSTEASSWKRRFAKSFFTDVPWLLPKQALLGRVAEERPWSRVGTSLEIDGLKCKLMKSNA